MSIYLEHQNVTTNQMVSHDSINALKESSSKKKSGEIVEICYRGLKTPLDSKNMSTENVVKMRRNVLIYLQDMDPVALMAIAANLATFFSFGGDIFDRLSESWPSKYTQEEIQVWSAMIDSINHAESNLMNEIKGDEHRRLIADLASEKLKFISLVNSLRGADLASKLDEFIVQFESKNFEFNLANLLNSTFHGQKSFLQVIIEGIRAGNAGGPPQKVLYEIYLSLAEKIGEANTLHRFAVAKKSEIQGTLDCTNFKYIDNTLTTAVGLLKAVIGSAFKNFKAMDGRICCSKIADEIFSEHPITLNFSPTRVKSGHVVTGFRFTKVSNVVHLQLQSAKLMPLGIIDPDTVVWEELNKIEHNNCAAVTSLVGSFIDQDIALTGVEIFCNNGALSLKIIGRRFDFETGRLGLDEISKNLTGNQGVRSSTRLSLASVSLNAPLAAINILKITATGQFLPVAVSLDYRRLLELNVITEVQRNGSSQASKTQLAVFLTLLLQISRMQLKICQFK